MLDDSSAMALSLKCPNCQAYLSTNDAGSSTINPFSSSPGAAILVRYKNEGGFQPDLDILPSIIEEAYLTNHPEARPARAFLSMCSEGDADGIVELLATVDGDEEAGLDLASVIKYQDPLSGMKSALHLAVEQGQVEVALLLLWLSSAIPSESFPDAARRVAESAGVGRLPVDSDEEDIRRLKDSNGLTPEHLARRLQGPWVGYLDAGLL